MQKMSARFRECACFASVMALKLSFISDEDQIRFAIALLNKKDIQHPHEDVGLAFKYIQACQVLRGMLKFSAASSFQSHSRTLGSPQ